MSNDELQKAIDDITKETAPAPAENVAAETEALANEIAGATAGAAAGGAVAPSGAPVNGEGVTLSPQVSDSVAQAVEQATAQVGNIEIPAAPAPAVPEIPAMPPSAAVAMEPKAEAKAVEPAETPKTVETEKAEGPVRAEEKTEKQEIAGMDEIKKEALKELYPLLDKTDMSVEEKFDICMGMQSEPDAIKRALGYAKQFGDADKKVDALLKIYRM